MQNLTHSPEVTETFATNAVFDACRANPERLSKYVCHGSAMASFTLLADGTHEVCIRSDQADLQGVVIALANVDQFDI